MQTYKSVDWLRWTCQTIGNPPEVVDYDIPAFEPNPTAIKAVPPYQSARRLMAARMDWHINRPDLKTMITMSGSDMETAMELGVGVDTIIAMMRRHLANPTRIDLALDVFEGDVNAAQFYEMYQSGKITAAAKRSKFITGYLGDAHTGDTAYIGSRQSERLVRVYDKGKEQGLRADWLRIELELKGRTAAAAVAMIERVGVDATVRAYLAQTLKSDEQWWAAVLGADAVETPPKVHRKETSTKAWLIDTILPTMERVLVSGDDDGILRFAIDEMLKRADNGGYTSE